MSALSRLRLVGATAVVSCILCVVILAYAYAQISSAPNLQYNVSSLVLWIIGSAFGTIACLIGVIYNLLRREIDGKQSKEACSLIERRTNEILEEIRRKVCSSEWDGVERRK